MDQTQLFISNINHLGTVDSTLPYLDDEEKQRFSGFEDDKARALFGHGRRMMKILLASHLNREPKDIKFSYSSHGKPFLPQQIRTHFNLARKGSVLCFGISTAPLGVDIEMHKPIRFLEAGKSVFNPSEFAKIEQIGEIERSELFYTYWTRKEAFIKCQGYGYFFPIPLSQVDIRGDAVAMDIPIPKGSQWDYPHTIHSFTPQPGYSGAAVVRAPSCLIEVEAWS